MRLLGGPYVVVVVLALGGGTQAFFTDKGRAFCLYVVLGSFRERARLMPRVNGVLETVQIEA